MKKSVLAFAAGLLCAVASTAMAADQPMLADRHVARGTACTACHAENPPAKAVPAQKCQTCHGDFEAMKARTDKLKPNPHYTHMGDQPCEECHKGHQKPVNMCDKCHQIKLNVR